MFKALFELIQTRKLSDISVSELCELAGINRTTFYNHFDNVGALAKAARESILQEYTHQFDGNQDGFTPENLLIMFRHLRDNQLMYNTYFLLEPRYDELLNHYDRDQARQRFPGQNETLVRYHAQFFAAGLNTVVRDWLTSGCKETPEEMVKIITTEYKGNYLKQLLPYTNRAQTRPTPNTAQTVPKQATSLPIPLVL